ncbi:MAG: response regulator [Fibrobacter sp.]|nr:response regulator [Fibrobacter sp.]
MYLEKLESRKNIRILAIEDEELIREYVCDFLEDIGFTTLQAPDGRRGLEIIRSEHPDLVFTDLRMPEMNGLDLLAVVQKEFPELPVIVISGTGTLADVVQSMKNGAWDYILKPIHDYSVLELSISRTLERKKLLQENHRYNEHLEEEVVKRTEELVKSTSRFKTLFNFVADAIFIHDLSGNIIDINQKAVDSSGYSYEQLLGMKMQKLFANGEVETFTNSLRNISADSGTMYESLHIKQDGTEVPVEVNACMIVMDSSPQILSVCRNISERKRAEEERRQLEKQIYTAQKMESLGLLASGIAHDFNNILAALHGYTTLLRQKVESGGTESEYLYKINAIVLMGQNLTRRITTFIRKEEEELESIDIHKVLSDTETLMRPNCRDVDVSLDLKASVSFVLGDENQLQNAFLNLGINARDAMLSGGKLKFSTINELDEKSGDLMVCIRVTDTGTGMSKETMAKIFDPLFTTKDREKGTGLGLTSVLYCVNNLHGSIDVESELGQGTEFIVKLPALISESQNNAPENC